MQFKQIVSGHCLVEDGVLLSGNSAVHQFVRIGRLSLLSGCSVTTKDMPPYVIQQGINQVHGVNVVGMRRAGMTQAQINAVRHAFHVLYRQGQTVPAALEHLEKELGDIDAVVEMISFIRQSTRASSRLRRLGRATIFIWLWAH